MNLVSVWVPGIFFVLSGLGAIVLRKMLGRAAVIWNLRLWRFATGEKEYQLAFAVIGVTFLIFGVLILLGIL